MKDSIDVSQPNVWVAILTPEEFSKVEAIINKMNCKPRPTVSQFLDTIRAALDAGMLPGGR